MIGWDIECLTRDFQDFKIMLVQNHDEGVFFIIKVDKLTGQELVLDKAETYAFGVKLLNQAVAAHT